MTRRSSAAYHFTGLDGHDYTVRDGACVRTDQIHATVTAGTVLAGHHPTAAPARRQAADWVRSLADRVEAGELDAIEAALAAMRVVHESEAS